MRTIISFVFLFLGLSSCANIGKNEMKAEPIKDVNIEDSRNEVAFYNDLFVTGDWPEKNWWDDFNDPKLSGEIERALKENPSLQSVQAKLDAVKGQADVVKSNLFPKLNALFNLLWVYFNKDIQRQFPCVDPNFHFYTLGFDFSYEFDFWGKNKKLFLAALGEVKTQEAMLAEAKIVLSTTVAISYYNLHATAGKIALIRNLLDNKVKQLELIMIRDKHRIDNLIHINHAKEEVLSLQESFAALKEELLLHKSSFQTLLGANPSSQLAFDLYWKPDFFPFEIPNEIGLNLLARRADLAAQMARVKKSASLVGVAISQFYPSVNLAGLLAFQDLDFGKLCSGQSFMPTLFPLIQLPILQGGKLRANLKEKVALHESAVYEYNEAILRAANEVVKGINRLTSVNERLSYQIEKSEFAKEVSSLTDIKYNQGIDSLFKSLHAREKYYWAELHQVELERLKYHAIIHLIKALGGGYSHE